MNHRNQGLRLLPPEALLKTGEVDHADWNFRPLLGSIIRARYNLAVSLLEARHFQRLLEVGYGSGVFMPELRKYCTELYGVDVHPMPQRVAELLATFNVRAQLFSASVAALPFEEKFFDCIVAISTLEFVDDLDAACVEIKRVLETSGSLLVVTPGHSPIADFGLKVLTGKRAADDFGDRRHSLIPTLLKHFTVRRRLTFPSYGSSILQLYTAFELCA